MLGVPCSGMSTAAAHLRSTTDLHVLDMDDEVVRRNGGVWPDIERKNEIVVPQVLDHASALDAVVLLNSYSLLQWTRRLRTDGFTVALLDLSPEEQAQRDAVRSAEEGWTNREWFAWHREVIAEHHQEGLIDVVVDGHRPVDRVAAELAQIAMTR